MRSFHVVTLPLLASSLLAGCLEQPGTEPGDEGTEALIAEADLPLYPASEDPALAQPLDARQALDIEGQILGVRAPVNASLSSWFSGTVAAGSTQHWTWNNANLSHVFQIGLSPIGASTASPCQFEVTRQWDVQTPAGEREVHFYVKNTGSIACGANILLESKSRLSTWSTNGIGVGASKSFTWNNANTSGAYFANVSPSGATASSPCQLEVTRQWYVRHTTGEKEFRFTVKNVGAIACQGDIQLGFTTAAASSWLTSTIVVGGTHTGGWNNANPLTRIYVPGLTPYHASGVACQLEVPRQWYRQVINTNGTAEREFYFHISNVGSVACVGTLLLNYMD